MKKLLSMCALLAMLSISSFALADTWDIPVELFNNNGCIIMKTVELQTLTGFTSPTQKSNLSWYYYITGCNTFGSDYPIVVDINNNQMIDPCQLGWWPNSSDAVCRTKDSLLTPYFSSYESSSFIINNNKPRANVIQWTAFDLYIGTTNARYMYYFWSGSYSFQYDTSDPRYANLLATWYVLHTGYTGPIPWYITPPLATSFAPIIVNASNFPTNYVNPRYFFHRIPVIKLPWWTAFKEVLIPVWWHLVPQTSVIYEMITKKIYKKKKLSLPRI